MIVGVRHPSMQPVRGKEVTRRPEDGNRALDSGPLKVGADTMDGMQRGGMLAAARAWTRGVVNSRGRGIGVVESTAPRKPQPNSASQAAGMS